MTMNLVPLTQIIVDLIFGLMLGLCLTQKEFNSRDIKQSIAVITLEQN